MLWDRDRITSCHFSVGISPNLASPEVQVSRSGIVTLYKRFLSLATHRDKETNEHFLTEIDFQSIVELQQNPLGQRIIDAFFADAEVVERRKVYFRDFVKVLSHFRPINKNKPHPWNSREAKLRFAFTMYDLNKSGTITKDEFKDILQMFEIARALLVQLL
ncbi:Calcineurin subunit B [Trichostrongylus colubriformis]|uniref:Calcineurin subunit B n=1 Tax=Trichostrongylus colubriformis TaxID=6319 RepID=A0AAN8ITW6_TRICO